MSSGYIELLDEIREEFPDFKIVWKHDSKLMKWLGRILWFLTFGAVTTFQTKYITVIGCTMYVPEGWGSYADATRMIILRHERVHMRQRRALTIPLYLFLYLCCPLPAFLAYFRTRFEMEAYEETIRATVELLPTGYEAVMKQAFKDKIVNDFIGPGYCWMWPFRKCIEGWYDATVSRVLADQPAE